MFRSHTFGHADKDEGQIRYLAVYKIYLVRGVVDGRNALIKAAASQHYRSLAHGSGLNLRGVARRECLPGELLRAEYSARIVRGSADAMFRPLIIIVFAFTTIAGSANVHLYRAQIGVLLACQLHLFLAQNSCAVYSKKALDAS